MTTPALEFLAIGQDGAVDFDASRADGVVREVINAHAALYRDVGFVPPWIGYLARERGQFVGVSGFKAPAKNGSVEIAYFTFPGHEGRGVASKMARHLIALARETDPAIRITAMTTPQVNASTMILRKLGFTCHGEVQDPHDGKVWSWELPNDAHG